MLPAFDAGGGAVFINADSELETNDEAREPRQRKSTFTRGRQRKRRPRWEPRAAEILCVPG